MLYYPHHIGDFVRDTSRPNDSQSMAYLRLIWLYYESEQPLPDDVEALAFRIGSKSDDVLVILHNFFILKDRHWHNVKCDAGLTAIRQARINHWGNRLSKERRAAIQATRNATKANATPIWLSAEQKQDIEDVYFQSAMLTATTGVKHEVDHIVPLMGVNVCGLHVAWNLRAIPAHENRRKSNFVETSL